MWLGCSGQACFAQDPRPRNGRSRRSLLGHGWRREKTLVAAWSRRRDCPLAWPSSVSALLVVVAWLPINAVKLALTVSLKDAARLARCREKARSSCALRMVTGDWNKQTGIKCLNRGNLYVVSKTCAGCALRCCRQVCRTFEAKSAGRVCPRNGTNPRRRPGMPRSGGLIHGGRRSSTGRSSTKGKPGPSRQRQFAWARGPPCTLGGARRRRRTTGHVVASGQGEERSNTHS